MEKNKKYQKVSILVIILLVAVIATITVIGILKKKVTTNNEITPKSTVTSKDTEDYFILYKGNEMKITVGENRTELMEINEKNNKKYNVDYYNYEHGKFLGITKGLFGEEVTDGFSKVENVNKIAISKEYNAVPRDFTESDKIPEELNNMSDCSSFKINYIDLDGDGTEEKIVWYSIVHFVGNGSDELQKSSVIVVFNSDYERLGNLITVNENYTPNDKNSNDRFSLDNVEYIDIDNDRTMEIIIEVPESESNGDTNLSVLKYEDGKIEGKTDIKANIQ